jgi:hypothetical protein
MVVIERKADIGRTGQPPPAIVIEFCRGQRIDLAT